MSGLIAIVSDDGLVKGEEAVVRLCLAYRVANYMTYLGAYAIAHSLAASVVETAQCETRLGEYSNSIDSLI